MRHSSGLGVRTDRSGCAAALASSMALNSFVASNITMHAHIVLAHPEHQSFNAHLARCASQALAAQGWSLSLSDLYGMGFDPCERPEHYRAARKQPSRFDVQAE